MREIKFRAFDPDSDEMHDIQSISFVGAPTVTIQYSPVKKKRLCDVELMQFTGLYDCNGVEIYESDVVDCGESRNYAVSWNELEGSWYAVSIMLADCASVCKVIGNIHQHKHLLGGENEGG